MILAFKSSRMNIILYCFLLGIFLLYACHNRKQPYTVITGNAQGTTFTIQYNDLSHRDFSASIDSLFHLIDQSMSLWDSTSVISKINRNDPSYIIDEHFENVFRKSFEVYQSTGGSFDPTISPLVKAWGFSFKKGLPPEDPIQVNSFKKLIGFDKIKLENGKVMKDDARIEIDFNAIAQGYTVDLISEFLEARSINDYLVEVGGEVRAKGVNERDSLWVIGIDKPVINDGNDRPLQTKIALDDQSLATSGSYRKYFERDGKKFSHVIDPATGYPVSHQMLSISVITDNCTTADAYATAFLVMGMDKAFEKALELEMQIFCIYAHDDGTLSVRSTPDFGK